MARRGYGNPALHPIAEQILDMYNTTDDENPVFPLPTLNSAWSDIHEIGCVIGRTENLSAHMARHTFGTMLVSESICLDRPKGLLREDPRLAVKKVGRPKKNRCSSESRAKLA